MTRAASSPDRSAAPRAVPALAGFGFPVAVVASELDTDGRARTLIEAGDVDEIFPFASVTKPIVAWSALVAVERGLLDLGVVGGQRVRVVVELGVGVGPDDDLARQTGLVLGVLGGVPDEQSQDRVGARGQVEGLDDAADVADDRAEVGGAQPE